MLTGRNEKKRHAKMTGLFKAALFAAVSAIMVICLAGAALAVDLTIPNSITVNIQDGFKDDAGLKNENLVVDIYLIAQARDDIEPAVGYDTYTLVATDTYKDLQDAIDKAQIKSDDNKVQWDNLTQEAVKLVRAGKGGTPVASGTVATAVNNLSAGLYLVLAHGKLSSYFYDNGGKGPISTLAVTEAYEYHLIPQLIALPYKESFNTGGDGGWLNDITFVLKGERKAQEKPIPKPDNKPKTGDRSNLMLDMVIVIASGVVLLALVIIFAVKRKRDKKTDESDR